MIRLNDIKIKNDNFLLKLFMGVAMIALILGVGVGYIAKSILWISY